MSLFFHKTNHTCRTSVPSMNLACIFVLSKNRLGYKRAGNFFDMRLHKIDHAGNFGMKSMYPRLFSYKSNCNGSIVLLSKNYVLNNINLGYSSRPTIIFEIRDSGMSDVWNVQLEPFQLTCLPN